MYATKTILWVLWFVMSRLVGCGLFGFAFGVATCLACFLAGCDTESTVVASNTVWALAWVVASFAVLTADAS